MRQTFALLALIPLCSATAQQPSRDTTTLSTVIVTATRVPLPLAATTASATVISGASLRERGITRVADALREVPGFALVSSGSPGASTSLFARGGNSNFVKVLVDGVPVNEAGGSFDFAHMTTDNIDRIEVVRGPVSAVYGSDAAVGVVQIFTRAANANATVVARGGTYGTYDVSGEAGRASGHAAFTVGAANHGTQGFYDFNGQDRTSVISGRVSTLDRPLDASLTVRLIEGEFHFPTTGSGTPVDSNAFTREHRAIVGVDLGKAWPRAALRMQLADNELRRLSDDQPDSPGDSSGFYSRSDASVSRRLADLRADLRLASGVIGMLGAQSEWQHEENTTNSRFSSFPPSSGKFDESRRNTALYSQLIADLRPLSLTASGRIDDNEKFGTFGTWRAGASLRLAEWIVARAGAGTAFREPSFAEVFSTAFTVGNPDLRPERTRTFEAGLNVSTPTSSLAGGVTIFDEHFENLIQYVGRPFGSPLPNYANLAAATARGVELEATTRFTRALDARATWTYLRTRVTNAGNGGGNFVQGEALIRRPTRAGSATLTWRSAAGTLYGTVTHNGSQSDRNFSAFPATPVTMPAFTLVDVGGEGTVLAPTSASPRLALTARIENVANTTYQRIYGYRTPGRTILVGARLSAR